MILKVLIKIRSIVKKNRLAHMIYKIVDRYSIREVLCSISLFRFKPVFEFLHKLVHSCIF